MGQWYNVIVKMKVKGAAETIKQSVDVFKTECPEWFDEVKDKMLCDTVYGCVAFVLAAKWRNNIRVIVQGYILVAVGA